MRRFKLSTFLVLLAVAAPVAWAARSISVLVNPDTELLTITTGTLIYGDDHAVTVTRSSGTFATDRTYRLTVKRAGQYNQAAYSYYTAGTVTTSALTFASVNLNVTALGQDLGDRPSIDVLLDITDGTDTTYGVARQAKVWNRARRPIDTAALNPSYNTYTDAVLDALLAAKSATTHGHTHNSTTSLQGGMTDQYYHVTAAQNTSICLLTAGETPITSNDTTTPARGQIFVRGATGWRFLPPGTDDYFLQTHGAGADPTWTALGGAALLNVGTTAGTVCAGDDGRLSDARTPTSHTHAHGDTTSLQGGTTGQYYHVTAAQSAQVTGLPAGETILTSNDTGTAARGSIMYRDATGWKYLAPGTADYHLATHGAGADPSWVSAAAGAGDVTGPSASVARQVARFDGVTGKIVAASLNYVADGGDYWIPELSTPAAPTAGYESIYSKAGGKWYTQTSGAVESCLATEFHMAKHSDLTTTAHGGIVATGDSRLSDARTPTSHDHSSNQLTQANTHESADTDAATSSLHHTIGAGATNAAAGNHTHAAPTYAQTYVVSASGGAYTSIATAYAAAKAASPTSTNRLLVLVYPGQYTEQLVMDTNYIDLAGADASRTAEIYTNSSGYTITKSCRYANITGMRIVAGASATGALDESETTNNDTDSVLSNCRIESAAARGIERWYKTMFACTVSCTGGNGIGDMNGWMYSCSVSGSTNGVYWSRGLGKIVSCHISATNYGVVFNDSRYVSSIILSTTTAIYGGGTYINCDLISGINGYVVENGANLFLYGCRLNHGGTSKPAIRMDGTYTSRIYHCIVSPNAYATAWLQFKSGGAGTPVVYVGGNISPFAPIAATGMTVISEVPQVGGDADGDMWYRASSAMARLAKGGANTILCMDGTGTSPTWAASATPTAHNQAFSTLTSTPTTVSGYGIVNAWRRNILVNASMAVSQYTYSYTLDTARQYTPVDNWAVTAGGAALSAVAQAASDRTGRRALNCLSLTSASDSVTTVDVDQRLEAKNIAPLLGSSVAFSAQIYNASGGAITPTLFLGTPAASDNFTTVTVRNNGGSGDALQSCANSAWTKVTWTGDVSAYTNLANGLEVQIRFPDGALDNGDNIKISEIQLEPGPIATDFDVLPYAQDLADCLRYMQVYGGESVYEKHGWGKSYSTTDATVLVKLVGKMRATPSVMIVGGFKWYDDIGAYVCSNIVLNSVASSSSMGVLTLTFPTATNYSYGTLMADNSLVPRIVWTARL